MVINVKVLPGLSAVIGIALVTQLIANSAFFQARGLSALSLAVLIGIAFNMLSGLAERPQNHSGIALAKGPILRLGIILFGLKITFSEISEVGLHGFLLDLLILLSTFSLALWLGKKWLKMDTDCVILIGAGSSICGAAAIMASQNILKAHPEHVCASIASVVIFGTLAMFFYPVFYPYLGFSEQEFGLYAGATVHEVAQVVVVGTSVGETAGHFAVIEKMLRVMLLAPFLLVLAYWLQKKRHATHKGADSRFNFPWFALGFVALAGLNTVLEIPAEIKHVLFSLDDLLLTVAMAALGLTTSLGAIKNAGAKPLLLGLILSLHLCLSGGVLQAVFR